MNILRYAFWGFIIILLLPATDDEKHAIYGGLKKIGWDVVTFCDRNPDVCQGVTDAFGSLIQKLDLGTKMVSDVMDTGEGMQADTGGPGAGTPMSSESSGSGVDVPPYQPYQMKPAVYRSQSTLTEEDLRPQWQGPRT